MTTTTMMPAPGPLKRCAIIGTAPSWMMCPWKDETLEVWTLNDGYLLGQPRSDRHYELHPPYQMAFRPRDQRSVSAWDVPIGAYVRPEGHLEWLRAHPKLVIMAQTSPAFPRAVAFPKQAVLDWFQPYWPWRLTRTGSVIAGPDYEVSTPAWMLMQAIAEGYGEIHIYGIHLATQWEYQVQRPNFEFLLGLAAGRGVKIVLPQQAPICQSSYRYAFEPKADIPEQTLQRQVEIIKAEGLALRKRGAALPWYRRAAQADIAARLTQLDVELMDTKQALTRTHLLSLA